MATPLSRTAEMMVRSLVVSAADDVIGRRFGELCLMAQAKPRETAEVLIGLAEHINSTREAAAAAYQQTHDQYLRDAHAAYVRGERDDWVIDGERTYQRNKKRRYRRAAA